MFVQNYSMRFHIVEPSTRGLKCCEASKNEPIWRVIFLNHQPAVDPTKVGLRLRMKSGTISVENMLDTNYGTFPIMNTYYIQLFNVSYPETSKK